MSVAAIATPAGHKWEAHYSEKRGREFYVNRETKEKTWILPRDIHIEEAFGTETDDDSETSARQSVPLRKLQDPSSGYRCGWLILLMFVAFVATISTRTKPFDGRVETTSMLNRSSPTKDQINLSSKLDPMSLEDSISCDNGDAKLAKMNANHQSELEAMERRYAERMRQLETHHQQIQKREIERLRNEWEGVLLREIERLKAELKRQHEADLGALEASVVDCINSRLQLKEDYEAMLLSNQEQCDRLLAQSELACSDYRGQSLIETGDRIRSLLQSTQQTTQKILNAVNERTNILQHRADEANAVTVRVADKDVSLCKIPFAHLYHIQCSTEDINLQNTEDFIYQLQ